MVERSFLYVDLLMGGNRCWLVFVFVLFFAPEVVGLDPRMPE